MKTGKIVIILIVLFLGLLYLPRVWDVDVPHVGKSRPIYDGRTLPEKSRQEPDPSESFATPEENPTLTGLVDFYASADAPEKSSGYRTISHRFLDISSQDIEPELYEYLDEAVIGETKTQLEHNCPAYQNFLRGNYSDIQEEKKDAEAILKTMDRLFRSGMAIFTAEEYNRFFNETEREPRGYERISNDGENDRIVLKKKSDTRNTYVDTDLISPELLDKESGSLGFSYKVNLEYGEGLRNREMDCDNMVINYLGSGEVMRLPISFVPGIRHAWLAWELSDGSLLHFETTQGQIAKESTYVKTENHIKLKTKGYYFNPQTFEETVVEAYFIRGTSHFRSGMYFNSVRDFCKVIRCEFDMGVALLERPKNVLITHA